MATPKAEVTFQYDPLGRRTEKRGIRWDDEDRDREPDEEEEESPRVIHYLYDQEDILATFDDSGRELARYTHGPGIDEPLAEVRKHRTRFYRGDNVGSTSGLAFERTGAARKESCSRMMQNLLIADNDPCNGEASLRLEQRHLLAENLRLVDELKQQFADQAILAEVGQLLNSTLDRREALSLVIQNVRAALQAETCSLLLRNADTGDLDFAEAFGEREEEPGGIRLPRGSGVAGWVAERGVPVIVNDAQRDARSRRLAEERTGHLTCSIACVPVAVRGETIGVIEVRNRRGGERFTVRDLQLLLAIADRTGVAIENARLSEELLRKNEQLERFSEGIIRKNDLAPKRLLAEIRRLKHSAKTGGA